MAKTDLLENSSLCNIMPKIITLQTSLAMGLITAKVLNSPFTLNKTKGMLVLKDEIDAGYMIYGNLLYNFYTWLFKQIEDDEIEEILFFGRDGYLLVPQYRYMCKILQKENPVDCKYLEISRRAMTVSNIHTKEDVLEIARKPYHGSLKTFMMERFGISLEEIDDSTVKMEDIQCDDEKLIHLVETYLDELLLNAEFERENYLAYLESLNIKGKRIAIVDTNFAGSTQWYLQKLLGEKVKGYYFVACLDETNFYLKENVMKGCFQKQTDTMAKHSAVFSHIACVEAFLTAPNGMFRCFTKDLKPCYAEKLNNQKHFSVREDMQKGVFTYLKDIVNLQKSLGLKEMLCDEIFADDYFGMCIKGGIPLTDTIKETFYFDKKLETEREVKIWSD